jgi:late competence protein required for DNA uptake (superfamily II DNA/RNA helicase)
MSTNTWCGALGIAPPRLEAVADHREANTFSLLLVALLERGVPMTLVQVASRFAQAGIADERRTLLSLQRCKPGRPPVYREGDLYHLDPHDHELDL